MLDLKRRQDREGEKQREADDESGELCDVLAELADPVHCPGLQNQHYPIPLAQLRCSFCKLAGSALSFLVFRDCLTFLFSSLLPVLPARSP